METKSSTLVLKIGLWLQVVLNVVYGLQLLLVPTMLVAAGGGETPDFAWLRWSGGVLLAIAYGSFRVVRKPQGQNLFVLMMIIMGFLNSAGHLISLLNQDYTGAAWMVWLPMVLTSVFSVILIIGRQQARGLLTQG